MLHKLFFGGVSLVLATNILGKYACTTWIISCSSSVQIQIAKYKADILKLQSSEAEIRALSVNYAAMLKEKEVV